jgi:hypothetical protein
MRHPWILAVCGLLATSPGLAHPCKPLTLLTRVHFQRDRSGTRIAVPVVINGKSRQMLLDTGASFSLVSPAAVKALHLPSRATDWHLYLLSGNYSQYGVRARTFSVGGLHWRRVDFFEMATNQNIGGHFSGTKLIGALGDNMLRSFDVDIDYGSNTLSILSPDHCRGRVIYWDASAVAAVPMSLNAGGQITVPAVLDGVAINAIIDTGASRSVLNLATAESDFSVTPGSPQAPRLGSVPDSNGDTYFVHRFHSLTLSGIKVSNPQLVLVHNAARRHLDRGPALGSLFSRQNPRDLAPLLIGGDILQHFHIYIAYREHMLYITPASMPQH